MTFQKKNASTFLIKLNNMSKSRVSPMSRAEIRNYASKIRQLLGFKKTDFIHAPKLFDLLSDVFSNQGLDFDFRIMPDDHDVFYDKEEAYTDMSTGIIYIKESVMDQACRRAYNRATFTLIHELGHFLLHYLQEDVRLTRVADCVVVPPYCDPEWQADTFASEFLMPYDECINMNKEEIRKTYHVSRKAAEVRYNKLFEDKLSKMFNEELNKEE